VAVKGTPWALHRLEEAMDAGAKERTVIHSEASKDKGRPCPMRFRTPAPSGRSFPKPRPSASCLRSGVWSTVTSSGGEAGGSNKEGTVTG
jgi:hypothetical protein